jgi:hypothetical protein
MSSSAQPVAIGAAGCRVGHKIDATTARRSIQAASMDAMLLWLNGAPRSFRKPCAAISAATARRLSWPPFGRLRLRALASATTSGSATSARHIQGPCRRGQCMGLPQSRWSQPALKHKLNRRYKSLTWLGTKLAGTEFSMRFSLGKTEETMVSVSSRPVCLPPLPARRYLSPLRPARRRPLRSPRLHSNSRS